MLVTDGFLREVGSGWEVVDAPPDTDPESKLRSLWFRYPASSAELTLVRRAAVHLADVLRGEIDPLELIFPDGSLSTTDHLYQHSPSMRPLNMIAASAITHLTAGLPEDRKLRLLEIGAGTGGLSSFVLPQLPRERTEYVFTDVSNHFFVKAQERFRDYPFVEYKLLDIEKDPTDQELKANAFDVVLASNVLHATRDLRTTVQNAKKLLSPGGLLLLVEGERPVRAMDLVFGLTEGFFRFADKELRPSHAMLPFAGWKRLLEEEGFEDPTCASGEPSTEVQYNVILARRKDSPAADTSDEPESAPEAAATSAAGRWLVLADGARPSERIAEELRARGGDVYIAVAGETYERVDDHHYEISAARLRGLSPLALRDELWRLALAWRRAHVEPDGSSPRGHHTSVARPRDDRRQFERRLSGAGSRRDGWLPASPLGRHLWCGGHWRGW